MRIDADLVESLIVGGAVLGGGGGGSMVEGRRLADEALVRGTPTLVPIETLADDDVIVTVSAVGAPAARERHVTPGDFVDAAKRLQREIPLPIAGFISSENGGTSSVNGLVQSAVLGIPVIDAPANGRAHPTGVMGSMGLGGVTGFVSRQAAIGGDPEAQRHLSVFVEAPLAQADRLVRQAAVEAGGMVAVARNPVPARHARTHGAPGALALAMRIGEGVRRITSLGGPPVANWLADALGGRILAEGRVTNLQLRTEGGYDVGALCVGSLELTFWNEYMTADVDGLRVGTFPDLLATLDVNTGMPIGSADLRDDQPVVVLWVPRRALILGAGMREQESFAMIEQVLGRPIVRYVFPGGGDRAPSDRDI